jgi:predicted metal-binding protein
LTFMTGPVKGHAWLVFSSAATMALCEENRQPLSGLEPGTPAVISVCVTCRARASSGVSRLGDLLHDALGRILQGHEQAIAVRTVRCLGVCERPATVAVSAPNGYTFVFGDLDPQSSPAAIAEFAHLYLASDYGFVPRGLRPEPLRTRLVARIPSVTWSPVDGRPPG